jgi:hypothetical protein
VRHAHVSQSLLEFGCCVLNTQPGVRTWSEEEKREADESGGEEGRQRRARARLVVDRRA